MIPFVKKAAGINRQYQINQFHSTRVESSLQNKNNQYQYLVETISV